MSYRPSIQPEDLQMSDVIPAWWVAVLFSLICVVRWRGIRASAESELSKHVGDVLFMIATGLIFLVAIVLTAQAILNETT